MSHSSTDQWIASKVAEDLAARGVSVFLDVKDISTGDDFDDMIRRQMKESDELLVLISPGALRSHWVMMEIGAARALGKRLAIITIGVSPNKLPDPINRHLARDINQIERYYEELGRRRATAALSGQDVAEVAVDEPVIVEPPRLYSDAETIIVGDRVRISESPSHPDEWPVLVDAMRQYFGRTAKVMAKPDSFPNAWGEAVYLDVDNQMWLWSARWLTKDGRTHSGRP